MTSDARLRLSAGVGLAVVLIAAVALMSGCVAEEVLPAPRCDDGGSALIVAQSVPTASQIPCLGDMPDGWKVASVHVGQDGTAVWIDSDRAGKRAAALRLDERCDVSGAVSAPSDLPPAERFDEIDQLAPRFRGERYYVFDGGCVWWEFEFDEGASATETVEIGNALALLSRASLNENLRETFIQEEL